MGWSIKKPLGSKNSFVNRAISKPLNTLAGSATGMGVFGGLAGMGLTDLNGNFRSKMDEYNRQMGAMDDGSGDINSLAAQEQMHRHLLGLQQQGQINKFADDQQAAAGKYRTDLASSLAKQGQDTFAMENPYILEDLNSRGLFSSESARNQSQSEALKEIALSNQRQLSDFDTQSFNNINDLRGSGLSALLGGDQSALDSALELKKAGIQRSWDQQSEQASRAQADMLARRQSRDNLLGSILGFGGAIGGGLLCFDPDTKIEMKDGWKIRIGDVQLGDILADGGTVTSVRDAMTDNLFFDYNGVRVTSHHAVKENGRWVRVKDSAKGVALHYGGPIRSLGTSTNRLMINGNEFADEFETKLFGQLTLDESLAMLNKEVSYGLETAAV